MLRRSFLGALAAVTAVPQGNDTGTASSRPRVPGTLSLRSRRRSSGEVPRVTERVLRWEASQTAMIVCDMWDTHTCNLSAQRVGVMAPRMNEVLTAARGLGVMIIHAPSDTMKFYEGAPARQKMQRAPAAASPVPILARCPREPMEEKNFPIDDSEGGCDDAIPKKWTGPYPWTRQHPAIDITDADGISENGQEIYNFCKQEGITNIALMGVHTNICILNRSFGIRQFTRLGFHVALARDLTDAMYDPRKRPFVSHTRGTELIIEHIETNWCPSVLSEDLTRVIPGTDNPRKVTSGTRSTL